ncbi:MAG: antibiotic biosynthesis monooxygenase [Clostridia bacterium]|nr:antibiotic biosynthesis monooxygenase [Clostridia bacterium]
MGILIHIYYTGVDGSAKKFAQEMIESGIVNDIRAEEGNLKYDYFFPLDDEETVLLINKWKNQEALDIHHKSEMMTKIAELRKKYKLKMKVERFEF